VGYPYSQTGRAGGSAYDCSSLAFYAWQAAGVDISYGEGYPPTAASEASKIYSMGTPVSTTTVTDNDLKPGDLIFYGGHENGRFLGIYHVAIYAGNGEVVEALNEEHGVVYETLRTNNMILVLRP
jgi:cell wall-associated NlpC family hydrolase